jgi:uncharacterized damage-inducible protein DinB
MSLLSNLQLMSQYNQWMNQKLYQAAMDLGLPIIQEDRGAFFGSIFGTLNHVYLADVIWLRRFAQHPQQYPTLTNLPKLDSYTDLRAIATSSIENLSQLRQNLDKTIINWCQEIEPSDLEHNLEYTDTKGNPYCKNFGQLIQHFFNHQTHHRGQATTLFTQQNIDIGVTDLLKIIPEPQT